MNEVQSHPQQLLDELRQICRQYSKEVPGRRRPWPKSIRERVDEREAAELIGMTALMASSRKFLILAAEKQAESCRKIGAGVILRFLFFHWGISRFF